MCHIEKEGKRKDVVAPPRNAYRGMGDSSFRNFLSFPTVVGSGNRDDPEMS